jgi:pimeloyl-ACP methyl ester carboxylesterase
MFSGCLVLCHFLPCADVGFGVEQIVMEFSGPLRGPSPHETDVCGYKLQYQTGGSGPAVVLLHGLGAGNYTWRYVLTSLMRKHTVYALDLLGSNRSDKPQVEYSTALHADYVYQFIRRMGISQAHIVAHSMGGPVGINLCWRYPATVDRLVLIASGGLTNSIPGVVRLLTLPGAQVVTNLLATADPRSLIGRLARITEEYLLSLYHVLPNDDVPRLLTSLRDADWRRAYFSWARAIARDSASDTELLSLLARRNSLSVLFLWGTHDSVIPMKQGLAAARILPNSQFKALAGVHHEPQVEAPDLFCQTLLHFLNRLD